MPHSFPNTGNAAEFVGQTPWSGRAALGPRPEQRYQHPAKREQADGGVGRSPGGLPHDHRRCGLTAAGELLARTGIQPVVPEKSGFMGGLSRTVNYKGNRMDIGGHGFFSKPERVMKWWLNVPPPRSEHAK